MRESIIKIDTIRRIGRFVPITVLFVILFVLPTDAQPKYPEGYYSGLNREEIFQRASEFYRNAEPEKALNGFLYLVELGFTNGYLYYNLGNTYYQLGEVGNAILWYERASRYLTRFDDLHYNYEYARSKLADEEFRLPEPGGTVGFFLSLHNALNLNESLWFTAAMFWIFALVLAYWIYARSEQWKRWLRIPCWILGAAVILFVSSTGVKLYQYEYVSTAIVMRPALDVKTGPGEDFSTNFTLHEGTQVRIVQRQNGWSRIIMPGKVSFTGWIPDLSITEV